MTSERAVEPLSTAEETTLRSLTVDDWPPDREHFLDRLWATLDAARAATPAPREDGWEELRRLAEAATPGPWRQTGTKAKPHWYVTSDTAQVHGNLPPTREDYTPDTIERWIADAAFIVAAVNYVRDRLAATRGEPWDPHGVDGEHPCIVCGRITSHDHDVAEFDVALAARGEPPEPAIDVERLARALTRHRTNLYSRRVVAYLEHACMGDCCPDIAAEYDRLAP